MLRVVARATVAALALASLACGSPHSATEPDPTAPPLPEAPPGARCRVFTPPGVDSTADVRSIAPGPAGTRTFGGGRWWDRAGSGSALLAPSGRVAWTGADFLVLDERAFALWDPGMHAARARRPLPAHACEPQVLPVPGGFAMLYRRIAHGTNQCADETGPVVYQRLGPPGAPVGPPVELGRGEAARAALGRMSARLDAGRIVVTTAPLGSAATARGQYVVLTPDGRELAHGAGGHVACPRAGCVQLLGAEDRDLADDAGGGGGEAAGTAPGPLRMAVLGRGSTVALPLDTTRVADLAVQGDRVLVRYAQGHDEGGVANLLAVVDVPRRAVVPLFDEEAHQLLTFVRDSALYDDARLVALPTGFAYTSGPASERGVGREIDCAR